MLAGAGHERVDQQGEFVKQSLLKQELDKGPAGPGADVLAGLLLELGEFGRDVTADERRGSPVRMFQGALGGTP